MAASSLQDEARLTTMTTSTEQSVLRLVMLKAASLGMTVWRNNSGAAWTANRVERRGRDVLLQDARPLRAGLCSGSSDLIGIKPVTITQDMVGSTIGQFVAIEVKTKTGRVSPDQRKFLDHVKRMGGVAVVARNELDL